MTEISPSKDNFKRGMPSKEILLQKHVANVGSLLLNR